MIVLMNGEKMIHNVFKDIPEVVWQIIDLSENLTTLVPDKSRNVVPHLVVTDSTQDIKFKKQKFCFKLVERIKKTLVYTSTNISGQPTPKSFKEISPEIIKGVDYVINFDSDKISGKPVTIKIFLSISQVKIIPKLLLIANSHNILWKIYFQR